MEDGSEKYNKRKLNESAPKIRIAKSGSDEGSKEKEYYRRKLNQAVQPVLENKKNGMVIDEELRHRNNIEFVRNREAYWKNRYIKSLVEIRRLQGMLDQGSQGRIEDSENHEETPIVTNWSESYEKGEEIGKYEREKEPHEFMSERYSLPEEQPNESVVKKVIRRLAEASIGYLRRNPEQIERFEKKNEGAEVEQQRPPLPPLPPMPPGGVPARPIGKPYLKILEEMKSKEESKKDNL